MAKRKLNDWISGYLEYADESEPPLSYHTWVSISLIAGVLQRRTFFTWGYEIIYPNMYIVLIGPSGKCRKGTAMRMGYEIVKDVGIKIISEDITREAMIRNMKNSVENYLDPKDKKIRFHSSLSCFSEELSVFLGQNDIRFLSTLTNWYDSADKWTYETKGSGTDTIQGLCFNLLGATASDWLVSILPQEAIGGGFTSRVIFVVEEEKRKTLPKPIFNSRIHRLMQALKADLETIKTLNGPFVFTPETEELYINWYEEQDINNRKGNSAISDPRFAGYCERRATHLRKLCMIFSVSRGSDMVVLPDDFTRAYNTMVAVEVKMPRVFGGLGMARYSQITEKILTFLSRRRGRVSRSELMLNFYRDMDMETLEIIERTLEAMKVIKLELETESREMYYTYTGP